MKIILTIIIGLYCSFSFSQSWINSNFKLGDYISLEDHPKAQDVNLKIKKPVGWVLEEGERPHVVNTFVNNSNSYIILIKDNYMFVSRNEARDLIEDEEFNTNFISDFVENLEQPAIINKQVVTIDNYPALEFTVFGTKERLGDTIEMYMKYWLIYYEDKCITFLGATLNKNEFYSLESLFDAVTNSIIFPEQYK